MSCCVMRRARPPSRCVMECHAVSCSVCGWHMFDDPSGHNTPPVGPCGFAAFMSTARASARAAAAGVGCGHRSSFCRPGAGPCFARILRGRLCACRRAYRGGAARAPDCAREAEGAPLPSASHGFSESGAARPRNARDAAPDAASLGTIIPQSARCQAQSTNKEKNYQIFFMIREAGKTSGATTGARKRVRRAAVATLPGSGGPSRGRLRRWRGPGRGPGRRHVRGRGRGGSCFRRCRRRRGPPPRSGGGSSRPGG